MRVLKLLLDLCFPPRETERQVSACSADALCHDMRARTLTGTDPPAIGLLPYYLPNVQAALLEGKFHGNERAHALLGEVLAEYLCEFLHADAALAPRPIFLVPVPLSPHRLAERGYNQSERYAQAAAEEFGPNLVLAPELLVRTRDTAPQTSLGAQARRKNLTGAFVAPIPLDPHATYIAFDDVTTTGSTLAAAAEALRAGGARHIVPLALAY